VWAVGERGRRLGALREELRAEHRPRHGRPPHGRLARQVVPTLPVQQPLAVRGTALHIARDGNGPALLYLHGAGGAGRWLPFQEHLAEGFDVRCPSHPGHGGSPAAEWIEHISDLAFLYLDMLDELGLDQVHVVGASFGGWIAAEIAVMASHRLRSLALIDP